MSEPCWLSFTGQGRSPAEGVLGERVTPPSGKSRGRVTLWSGSRGETLSGFLGRSLSPSGERITTK